MPARRQDASAFERQPFVFETAVDCEIALVNPGRDMRAQRHESNGQQRQLLLFETFVSSDNDWRRRWESRDRGKTV